MLAPIARTRQMGRLLYDGLYCRHVTYKSAMGA